MADVILTLVSLNLAVDASRDHRSQKTFKARAVVPAVRLVERHCGDVAIGTDPTLFDCEVQGCYLSLVEPGAVRV